MPSALVGIMPHLSLKRLMSNIMTTETSPLNHKPLNEFTQIIEIQFDDDAILERALTHRSFVNEMDHANRDNERLEFLGDAILDFIVAEMLFMRFPDVDEGELTQLRAALVRTDSLAELATQINLGDFLRMGKGEVNSGGRYRANNLCRGYEAVVGAIYLDQGIQAVKDFVLPRLEIYLEYVLEHSLHKDARSMLQERSQSELRFTPLYRLVDAEGPDHQKEFFVEVLVGDFVIGEGSGTSKRAAAQSAARTALQQIDTAGWPPEAEEYFKQLETESDDEEKTDEES